ncbi:hypothetical protein GCM10008905_33030 [Clostridium malenominatum]|uniref:DUF4380 domain-containing protein n=1 Tax=Clostridium malenominatum TaxID=1539 RepID=A0ABP3UDK9_9CLOT
MKGIVTEEIYYKSFGKCVKITNNVVELYVTIEKGPRIIRYGFINRENHFCENIPTSMEVMGETWHLMGGHRLWHSPESSPRTYIPDNNPVKWHIKENSIVFQMNIEPWTQIKKEIEITLEEGSKVEVIHRLTNKGAWPVELSAWAITVMAPGGIGVIPQGKRETNLLPNRVVALWPYSKMNDDRVTWGDKYITIRQDKSKKEPFKMGISNEEGFAAYFNHNSLFIKSYNHVLGESYPDLGVSYETYTNEYMLEMETLSPLKKLSTDETITHIENWVLIDNVSFPREEEKMEKLLMVFV